MNVGELITELQKFTPSTPVSGDYCGEPAPIRSVVASGRTVYVCIDGTIDIREYFEYAKAKRDRARCAKSSGCLSR